MTNNGIERSAFDVFFDEYFDGAKVFLIRFWELGLIGGGLGAVIASLMIKRKPPNPPKPPA